MNTTIKKVLIIDNTPHKTKQTMDILKQHELFDEYYESFDFHAGFCIFETIKPDMVICASEIVNGSGIDFMQAIHSIENEITTPVVIISDHKDINEKIIAIEKGASNFFSNPLHPLEFTSEIKSRVKTSDFIKSLILTNKKLEVMSGTDPLTKLHNRRYLETALKSEIQRTIRKKEKLTLIMLDVDDFKKINDMYGHSCGDNVLENIADKIKASVREYDIAARFGGEEFVIVLQGTPLNAGMHFAERLRIAIQSLVFNEPMHNHKVTASFGVCEFPSLHVDNAKSLITQADIAMYRAKQSGKNRIVPFIVLGDKSIDFDFNSWQENKLDTDSPYFVPQ